MCPSGGFHVYEITGELEKAPEKVGYWNIDDVGFSGNAEGTCTAHVFRVHQRQQLLTAAFYNGGVRVVDLSGLKGISLGSSQLTGEGMKEIGYYRMPDADTWSAKTPQIDRKTGDFYLFGNDIARGLDIYRFDGGGSSRREPRQMDERPGGGGRAGGQGDAGSGGHDVHLPARRQRRLEFRRCSSPAGRCERWTRLPPSWGSWRFGDRGLWTTTRRARE